MSPDYDPVSYKANAIRNWNLAAQSYHDQWASRDIGPFKSTAQVIAEAKIEPGDKVLDVACGTGALSFKVAQLLGPSGAIVGLDFSPAALRIARRLVPKGDFIEMDAENIALHGEFDKIVCQYSLMFFPEPRNVLINIRKLIKLGGLLAVSVHGTPEAVPYFSTIMEPVLRYLPDIRTLGAPSVHRFGKIEDLEKVIVEAGFSGVAIKKFVFEYEAGTFEKYWQDFMSTTALSIRSRIESNHEIMLAIRSDAEEKSQSFGNAGLIIFPWEVLLATAVNK